MEPFNFHAELFDLRAAVLEALAEHGFLWLSDFGAVDLQHDLYGLEVTAIGQESDAKEIEILLRRMFPSWHHARTFYENHNLGELGWKVMISRSPENFNDAKMPRGECSIGKISPRSLIKASWASLIRRIAKRHS